MHDGNYGRHAAIWDWAGDDRTSECKFWCEMSKAYGENVLSAMAAIGQVGAYMAENGFHVTAMDITKEMVEEGQKRYGKLKNLKFIQADIRSFNMDKDFFDFAFIGSADLHHMLSIEDVKASLKSVNKHLRKGGGLGLELWYPSETSWVSPKRIFEPLSPSALNIKVWKEGQTEYDAQSLRVKITQEVYMQNENKVDHFTHSFDLQLYSRKTFFEVLAECGYSIKAEYGDYLFGPWNPDSSKWIVEAIKE